MKPTMLGPAPALIHAAENPRGTVILLHGLGSDALGNARELSLLQGAGFNAVGIDAPQHGRRNDPARDHRWATEKDRVMRELVEVAAHEMSAIVDALETEGLEGPYSIVGISLGGFSAWRALAMEPRLQTAVILLGSPSYPGEPAPPPNAFVGRRILAISAEHDEAVELGPTRTLMEALGDEVALDVIPGSMHAVPEMDWWSAWGRVVRWLHAV